MVRTLTTARKSTGGRVPVGRIVGPSEAREEPQDVQMEPQEPVPNFSPVRDWEDDWEEAPEDPMEAEQEQER